MIWGKNNCMMYISGKFLQKFNLFLKCELSLTSNDSHQNLTIDFFFIRKS
jgi:hypothetical protein